MAADHLAWSMRARLVRSEPPFELVEVHARRGLLWTDEKEVAALAFNARTRS